MGTFDDGVTEQVSDAFFSFTRLHEPEILKKPEFFFLVAKKNKNKSSGYFHRRLLA